MRTKALLGLAALAVSAVTCVAQSNVYSLNIVGYVNVDVSAGLNLIANPLKPSNGNYNITNTVVLPDAADGAFIYKWAGTAWSSVIPSWVTGMGWLGGDFDIQHGEGFFLQSPVATKVLFVGEVATGDVQTTLPSGLSVAANKVPVQENWPGKDHGNDGDSIYTWGGNAWGTTWGYIQGLGWSNGGQAGDNVDGPSLKVGEAAMYQNTGAPISWTRAFNPQ